MMFPDLGGEEQVCVGSRCTGLLGRFEPPRLCTVHVHEGRPLVVQPEYEKIIPPGDPDHSGWARAGRPPRSSGSIEGPVAQLCPEIRIDDPAVQLLPSYSPLRACSRSSWCQSDWFATFNAQLGEMRGYEILLTKPRVPAARGAD
jgi:hypothetical protein